jgi:2-polyprenyl-3-methyl-5-hydroxy-6-metoxy-1,4-benzoquinol methylase
MTETKTPEDKVDFLNREVKRLKKYEQRWLVLTKSDEFAIEYNTAKAMNSAYEDPTVVKKYHSDLQIEIYRRFLETLSNHCHITKKVLDAGCGLGYFSRHLLDAYPSIALKGFDFSRAAIDHAAQVCPEGNFWIHDVYTSLEERFNLVVCTEMLEHLENPAQAYRNLCTAIEPGGSLFLTVPDGRLDASPKHVNFWTSISLRRFLEDASGEQIRLSKIDVIETSDRPRFLFAIVDKLSPSVQ